jgi:hypothetical protein
LKASRITFVQGEASTRTIVLAGEEVFTRTVILIQELKSAETAVLAQKQVSTGISTLARATSLSKTKLLEPNGEAYHFQRAGSSKELDFASKEATLEPFTPFPFLVYTPWVPLASTNPKSLPLKA